MSARLVDPVPAYVGSHNIHLSSTFAATQACRCSLRLLMYSFVVLDGPTMNLAGMLHSRQMCIISREKSPQMPFLSAKVSYATFSL